MSLARKSANQISVSEVEKKIYTLRDQQVMLDTDLAEIFEIGTKVLKQAVRRKMESFPLDFMFELTKDEQEKLRSQVVTISPAGLNLRSQVVTLPSEVVTSQSSSSQEHFRYAPFAFTEQGVSMLSSVLRNKIANQIHITIIRAFAQIKKQAVNFDEHFTRYMKRVDSELLALRERIDGISQRGTLDGETIESQHISSVSQVREIQAAVARHFDVTVNELKSNSRLPALVLARHIAIYLVRKHLGLSLNEIGRHFGGRDHSTISHALEKIEQSLQLNKAMDSILATIHQ